MSAFVDSLYVGAASPGSLAVDFSGFPAGEQFWRSWLLIASTNSLLLRIRVFSLKLWHLPARRQLRRLRADANTRAGADTDTEVDSDGGPDACTDVDPDTCTDAGSYGHPNSQTSGDPYRHPNRNPGAHAHADS